MLTDTVKQKRSKAMDVCFYWLLLRNRARQKQFHIYWKEGTDNLADLSTKHHPTKHHIAIRPKYTLNDTMILALKAKVTARVC